MRVVIYHEEMGIYLGSALGMGWWSKLDPVGQPSAPTFSSEMAAKVYMHGWDDHSMIKDCSFIEVETNKEGYAEMEACVAVGLPAWDSSLPEERS